MSNLSAISVSDKGADQMTSLIEKLIALGGTAENTVKSVRTVTCL
jgi:hypothetical protein